MGRSAFVWGCSFAAAFALAQVAEHEAAACGGCFHPPAQVASDITDERMLLSVSPTQTTLYDQIRYAGSPASFAWVLPIHGTVDVGLSADVLFDTIDALTATQINPPPSTCAPPPNCGNSPGGFGTGSGAGGGSANGGVTVTKQSNVGPYATVQLHATDSSALEQWLADNGFQIPAAVQPVISQYVTEGFDFLAMKLLPGAGVQAMRPVRVTMPGASLALPLRMAAIGTGASVGITIWTVGDGRYEPQNFPFYRIADADLVWDWSLSASNYTTLRAQHEAALGGKGWELECSLTLNQQLINSVVLSGGVYYGSGFGGPVAPAADDYLDIPADDSGTNMGQTAEEVRTADLAALFAGLSGPNARVTRIRSDISHAAMTQDFVLQASADQSELSNQRYLTRSINESCPTYPPCEMATSSSSTSSGSTHVSSSGSSSASIIPCATPGCQGMGAGGSSGSGEGFAASGSGCSTSNVLPVSGGDLSLMLGASCIGLIVIRNVRRRRSQQRKA